jgi:D-alanyl-lipoteichoic acid acyltransferase DltB (MBOAT superfamily)
VLFNSHIFIFLFLPATFFVYFYLNRFGDTAAKLFLVSASLFFYGWWNPLYLPIIIFSMLFNYTVGVYLARRNLSSRNKKLLLAFGIVANIALLGYFKYADFFIENINLVANTSFEKLNVALPLAISFFTFQQIAYLVDSYRGETHEYNLLNYANFVTFFPQLIAGPIVHHKEMMPQFASRNNKYPHYANIAKGLFIFSIGLFKKVIIADTLAQWASAGFDHATTLNMAEAWVTSLSYTFQLYFDFSGYTDMAIGAALLFNIKLPANFDSPYKALHIRDFWRRWHMTLSRFLRDYIYIPLGGNQKGALRTYTNLMITFLIGGIWHGAGWTFLFWGFLHGFAMIVHRIWQQWGWRLPVILAWFVTFNFINITWVFFRAKEWDDALKVLKGMFWGTLPSQQNILNFIHTLSVQNFRSLFPSLPYDSYLLWWLFAAFSIALFFANSNRLIERFKPRTLNALYAALLFLTAAASLERVSEFLYFNF